MSGFLLNMLINKNTPNLNIPHCINYFNHIWHYKNNFVDCSEFYLRFLCYLNNGDM